MRRKTIPVRIGNIVLSSNGPVVIQSMLNTPTMNTEACVEQAIRIIEAGGELVRITAQTVKEAENLKNIHTSLREKGYDTPLSADIHFLPEAALVAAKYVEKVRINPGNFIDKRATFKDLLYTDEAYGRELLLLKEKFTEFLNVCRRHATAIRIGTNHGSLSDRIMSRFGNTPAGMVEATMEYLRVCKSENFQDVVVSLKSSDCKVMIDAVRLLVKEMEKEKMAYPLHLGVTEAGEGEDGRIRSAIGIGTLLNEGLGDTIRVSLTEPPENEISVARKIIGFSTPSDVSLGSIMPRNGRPRLVADISPIEVLDDEVSKMIGFEKESIDTINGTRLKSIPLSPEFVYIEVLGPELSKFPEETTILVPAGNLDKAYLYNRNVSPLLQVDEYLKWQTSPEAPAFIEIKGKEILDDILIRKLKGDKETVIVLASELNVHAYRMVLYELERHRLENKVILKIPATENSLLKLAVHAGGIFVDRLADGIWIVPATKEKIISALELSRNILQSAGTRRYKTEFISCPGCGRTLFDLQGVVAKVKTAFSHYDRLKIAVMGCVVNGPGEMGDADYGYVGAGNGKVNLYRGRELVKVAVPEENAIEELKNLIESDLSGNDF